ncbi:trehalase [Acipenser oxyrinchus oxyrinchus]|uniref:Trehalase n=1 Tax=Acipenser oxyrinchus oxyrinchus TaxID=40147 RepID=A0AAD8CLG8_ACIOX|nr:trehalase [Acipenser oxyrinchus oxyrinchus]
MAVFQTWISVLLLLLLETTCALPPPCHSPIYCSGALLKQVQLAKLFDDDKHFVDMKLKEPPEKVLSAFHNLTSGAPGGKASVAQLREFLGSFFEAPGQEFEPWTPADWHSGPQFLERISDPSLRSWAAELHVLWKSLGRKVCADVKNHPELYSQIYTPNPIIVPGGRFRELYYWDSYWVINGLLLSEMKDTARGMIDNFFHLVRRYGFIPNGGRVYYEQRSQPPFLTLMVESYYQSTLDKESLSGAVDLLEQEYLFWMRNRSVSIEIQGTLHTLNQYSVQAGEPRPESYSDDWELAEGLTEAGKQALWAELQSGRSQAGISHPAGSSSEGQNRGRCGTPGRDSSSRRPQQLLCRNERTIASFHRALGNLEMAEQFELALKNRVKAVRAVFWDESLGAWFDYSLQTNSSHQAFYPSNLAPLWAQCFSEPSAGERALRYLQDSGMLGYRNGVPTSQMESGEQWDYPNAWPPLQLMIIEGLMKLSSEKAEQVTFDLAQKWIRTNWAAYQRDKAMFEKYDVNGDGKPGGGGEYDVQLGFGWTNGVALQLLNQFGGQLTSGCPPLHTCLLVWLVSAALAFFM